jgi:ribosomal protein S18 acetylase RimI-like enzyme
MPLSIRLAPAAAGDAQTIAEMARRLVELGLPWTWTAARVTRHIAHTESVVLAARSKDVLVGFALMHYGDEVAHLNLLAVEVTHQRQGLGRDMIQWLEQTAVTAGIFLVCLEVRARNPGAIAFYQSLGYQEAGRLPRYYSGREDALRMTRDLRDPAARPGPGRAVPTAESGAVSAEWLLSRFRK